MIVRKLGSIEKTYSVEKSTAKHMVFTLTIQTKFDLYSRSDLVLKAVHEWKQMHPFLSCFVKLINNEHYFVYSGSYFLSNSTHNIDFLSFKCNKEHTTFKSLLYLLIENELNNPIACDSDGLMWRLKLFQVDDGSLKSDLFKYGILFSINHSICDGISGYNSLLHLFCIIESLHLGIYKRSVPFSICLPLEDYLLDSVQDEYFNGPETKLPAFCNRLKSKDFSLNLKQTFTNKNLTESLIYSVNKNNKSTASLKDLLEISRANNSKFRLFSIEDEMYKRLVDRCTKENVKLNSCFNIVFALAMKSIYKIELNQNEPIVYYNGVSLRNALEIPKEYKNQENMSLSYLANKFMNSFLIDADEKNYDFWELARENSSNIHSRLKENKFKKSAQCSFYHFFLSNYGKLESRTNKGLIEVKDLIVNQLIHKNNFSFICFIFAGTINDQIKFTVRFNSHFVSSIIIDKFIQKSKEIFANILN